VHVGVRFVPVPPIEPIEPIDQPERRARSTGGTEAEPAAAVVDVPAVAVAGVAAVVVDGAASVFEHPINRTWGDASGASPLCGENGAVAIR